jgi:hypothetical protein
VSHDEVGHGVVDEIDDVFNVCSIGPYRGCLDTVNAVNGTTGACMWTSGRKPLDYSLGAHINDERGVEA